jgi:hypothetical protein
MLQIKCFNQQDGRGPLAILLFCHCYLVFWLVKAGFFLHNRVKYATCDGILWVSMQVFQCVALHSCVTPKAVNVALISFVTHALGSAWMHPQICLDACKGVDLGDQFTHSVVAGLIDACFSHMDNTRPTPRAPRRSKAAAAPARAASFAACSVADRVHRL